MGSKRSFLRLRGCRQNNLANISLDIPKDKVVVITGVSGSGKSSLAFDTIFAEGQRRYLEYLSAEARRWVKQMPKPDVDLIEGLSPALAIGQHRSSLRARSTVATHTDIYDFLSVLYANIGEQHSPTTGKKLTRHTRQQMVENILKDYPPPQRIQLIAPIALKHETLEDAVRRLQKLGFIRILVDGKELEQEQLPATSAATTLEVVVDRLEMKEDVRDRLSASIDTALDLSGGILKIQEGKKGPTRHLTEVYVCPETGTSFAPLESQDFNFNAARGSCITCQGRGGMEQVLTDKMDWDDDCPFSQQVSDLLDNLPRKLSTLYQQVWEAYTAKKKVSEELLTADIPKKVVKEALFGSDTALTITALIEGKEKKIRTHWKGLVPIIEEQLQAKPGKSSFSAFDFVAWQTCDACSGGRLKAESLACLINGKNIQQLCALSIDDLLQEVQSWKLTDKDGVIAQELLPHIVARLQFLREVGLGYLELSRQGTTLSEGEKQRVQLASQIGAKLSGILYILDEPSLGLHAQDITLLGKVVESLRNLGNTVIIVEHNKELFTRADHIVELGPGSGIHGGKVVFEGSYKDLAKTTDTASGPWLSGRETLPKPKKRRRSTSSLHVGPVTCHNLNDFTVDIPLGSLVGCCGVSGSGKSTLVIDVLAEQLRGILYHNKASTVVEGHQDIQRLVVIGQQEAGISSRSIPATYIDVMTPIRRLFSQTKLARARGYSISRFSLNRKGGRCEACQGLGLLHVNMELMPDLLIPCDLCHGRRFNYETLQVTWENASIADVLDRSIEEAYALFEHVPDIGKKLKLMQDLGLEYLTLGQNFTTLSGGEIQRLKLVADLTHKHDAHTLYILDEPSRGLHFQDVKKLSKILHRLVDAGHSVVMVEHNLDLLGQTDHLIELGPGGGPNGGQIIFEGTPNKLAKASTPTAQVWER